jgi:hypothetical protein
MKGREAILFGALLSSAGPAEGSSVRADDSIDCVQRARHDDIAHSHEPDVSFRALLSACRKRVARRDALLAKLNAYAPLAWYETASDEALSGAADDARTAFDGLAVVSRALGKEPMTDAEVSADLEQIRAAVTREQTCQADKKCMADRAARKAEEKFFAEVVSSLCVADKDREQAQADIARERANPSGVVSLSALHEAGERVQVAQDQIRALGPAYTAVRKHAFRGWRTECQ